MPDTLLGLRAWVPGCGAAAAWVRRVSTCIAVSTPPSIATAHGAMHTRPTSLPPISIPHSNSPWNLHFSYIAGQARPIFPFTAIVGQEEMKLALILNVIDPKVCAALCFGLLCFALFFSLLYWYCCALTC